MANFVPKKWGDAHVALGAVIHDICRSPPLRLLLAVLVLAPRTVVAQRFDVVTFDAPPGWTQQALGDGLMFETRPAGGFCQIFLRKSRTPTAALPQELDRAWSELRERQSLVAATPDPVQADLPSGFTIAQRVGRVQTGSGPVVVMLNLLRKDDRLVTVVANISSAKAFDICGDAIGEFIAGLKLDATTAAVPGSPLTSGLASPAGPVPKSDPQLAAKFGNTVTGTWRFPLTAVNVTLNAPTQVRNVIEVRFARDGTYTITVDNSVPGSVRYHDSETGTYQVDGERIRMRPATAAGKASYDLEWFFGDHPEFPGNWGLILRSSADWPGSFGGAPARWRTFKPVE